MSWKGFGGWIHPIWRVVLVAAPIPLHKVDLSWSNESLNLSSEALTARFNLKGFAITSAENRDQAVNTHLTIKMIKEHYLYFELEIVQDVNDSFGGQLHMGRLFEGSIYYKLLFTPQGGGGIYYMQGLYLREY